MRAHLPALRKLERASHSPVRVVALCARAPTAAAAAAAAKALGRPVPVYTSLQQVRRRRRNRPTRSPTRDALRFCTVPARRCTPPPLPSTPPPPTPSVGRPSVMMIAIRYIRTCVATGSVSPNRQR